MGKVSYALTHSAMAAAAVMPSTDVAERASPSRLSLAPPVLPLVGAVGRPTLHTLSSEDNDDDDDDDLVLRKREGLRRS